MATALQRITGLTQLTISSSGTAPTEAQVTEFLNDGIKDFTNKIVNLRPDEAYKFAGESEDTNNSGIIVLGKVLSVAREHDSDSILRPCTPMSAELRYEATDVSSLHYRSKYNPGFYILNKKLYVVPAPGDASNNDAKVSQTVYGGTAHGTDMGSWTNFPVDYEDLVIYFAAAESCLAAAANLHSNMPNKPESPSLPSFERIEGDIELPEFPVYNPPIFSINLSQPRSFIQKEDFESAGKLLDVISKEFESYEKVEQQSKQIYDKESKIFEDKLKNLNSNKDREFQIVAGDYRSQIYKYQYDITEYQSELQETLSRYKWYIEKYLTLMNEYNKGITLSIAPQKRQQEEPGKKVKPPKEMKEGE